MTGTNVIPGNFQHKNSTNSDFYYINPYFNSVVELQFTQPRIAQCGPLCQYRSSGDCTPLAATIAGYLCCGSERTPFFKWSPNIGPWSRLVAIWMFTRGRFDLADASYKHDKRALELGALPPLDIYRSESEVAARRLQAIQSEYALKQDEDALRLSIGADQESSFSCVGPGTDGKTRTEGNPVSIDIATALQEEALTRRPEIEAAGYALANDDTGIRLQRIILSPISNCTAFTRPAAWGEISTTWPPDN